MYACASKSASPRRDVLAVALASALLIGGAASANAADLVQYQQYQQDQGPRDQYRQDQYRQDQYRQDQYRQDQYRQDQRRNDDRDRQQGGGPGGSYQRSCGNIRQDGSTLSAVCDDGRGRRVQSSIDLGRCGRSDIGNNGGYLQCGNVRGR